MGNSSNPTEIIVINQNGRDLLQECFDSILQTIPSGVKVTLMDNASIDDSVALVQKNFPSVHVLKFSKNEGFAGGYDIAIKKSDAEYIIMLNNDIKVLSGWFEPLIQPLVQDQAAITGSRLFIYDHPKLLDHAGGYISISGGGIDIGKRQDCALFSNQNSQSAYACGAAMAFRKSTYLDLGGFDSDYIIYHEDVDLGWKAHLSGLSVMHIANSHILHKVSASMGHFENPRRLFLSQRNRLMNLYKNAGFVFLIQGLVANILFDFFRALSWMAKGNFKNIIALIRADISAYASFPSKISDRRFVQKKIRKVSDRELLNRGTIVGYKKSLQAYLQLKR